MVLLDKYDFYVILGMDRLASYHACMHFRENDGSIRLCTNYHDLY